MEARMKKIGFCSFIFIILCITLVIVNYNELIGNKTTQFQIYGNVKTNQTITMDSLLDGTYERVEDRNSYFINSFGTNYEMSISGVSLADILTKLEILNPDAKYIMFEASDGYKSPKLPISLIFEYPEEILLVTHERGNPIKNKADGGDGPIKSFVSLESLQSNDEIKDYYENELKSSHVYNTLYAVKWVTSIYVI